MEYVSIDEKGLSGSRSGRVVINSIVKTYHSLRWLVVHVPVALTAFAGDAFIVLNTNKPNRADDFQKGTILGARGAEQETAVFLCVQDGMNEKLGGYSRSISTELQRHSYIGISQS